MVNVAVAGGSGHVGETYIEELERTQKHNVIMLTRKVKGSSGTHNPDTPEFVVDYGNVEQVASVLGKNNVDTVISTIAILDATSGKSELDLVAAAAKSSTTKRFIASNWGGTIPTHDHVVDLCEFPSNTRALEKTDLEWTQFQNGYFAEYYGMPYVESNLKPLTFVLDVANKAASITGTGNKTMTLTYTKDLAKFVVTALDLSKWTFPMTCYSDEITWNKAIAIAEQCRGMHAVELAQYLLGKCQ